MFGITLLSFCLRLEEKVVSGHGDMGNQSRGGMYIYMSDKKNAGDFILSETCLKAKVGTYTTFFCRSNT